MAPKKQKQQQQQENVQLGPQVREGELVFGVSIFGYRMKANCLTWSPQVARIFASFNDTFVRK